MASQPQVTPWEKLDSEVVLDNKWITVRQDTCRLPNGNEIDDYFVVERVDIVGIVALTEDNRIIVNQQYKHGIGEIVREIPAGMIDDGEEPEQAARRELEEETGYIAGEMQLVGTLIASPSSVNNRFYVYLARDVQPNGKRQDNPREEIINELVSIEDLQAQIASGDFNVMWSVAAFHLALPRIT